MRWGSGGVGCVFGRRCLVLLADGEPIEEEEALHIHVSSCLARVQLHVRTPVALA